MFKSYFRTAIRAFQKHKFHAIINILGLGIGICSSLLALLFVIDEVSFDTFHQNRDRLYRLNKISTESDGSTFLNAETSGMMGPTLVTDFPEVEKVVRFQPWNNPVMYSNNDRQVEIKANGSVLLTVPSLMYSHSRCYAVMEAPC